MSNTTIIVVVSILAGVLIILALLYGRGYDVSAWLKGPFKTGLGFKASKSPPQSGGSGDGPPPPGAARIEGVKAGRDAVAHDQTGQGATVKDTEAGRDAKATAIPPGENPRPKR